jgi:hypothetical protein
MNAQAQNKRVVFTMGGKGGVGKTGLMVALAEWFEDNEISNPLLDLDTENKARGSPVRGAGHGKSLASRQRGQDGCTEGAFLRARNSPGFTSRRCCPGGAIQSKGGVFVRNSDKDDRCVTSRVESRPCAHVDSHGGRSLDADRTLAASRYWAAATPPLLRQRRRHPKPSLRP